MSHVLIVESKNDRYFVEALVAHLNLEIELDEPLCRIDDYECLDGLNQQKLTNHSTTSLQSLHFQRRTNI